MKGELLGVLRGGPEVGDAWQLGATTQRVGAAFQRGGCADVVERCRLALIGRPVDRAQRRWGAVDDQTTDVFVLNEEQSAAARRPVQFGVGMLSHVQVIEGLNEGDRIALANTGRFSDVDVLSIE